MSNAWQAGDTLAPISIDLTLRRSVQAVAGTRDYYPFHHDEQYARDNGAEGIFFNTMFLQAFVGRAVCAWFGNDAFLRMLDISMRASNYVGRTLTGEGTVTATRESDGIRLVDADVTLGTEDGPTTAVKVTVQLPVVTAPSAFARP